MSRGQRVGRGAYGRALVELAFASDYAAVTVEEIVAGAGGTLEEFEELFPSKQACAVAAVEKITTRNMEIVRRAYASEEVWPDSLRAGAYAMATYIAEHPEEIRFGMLDMVWAGELTSALRDQFFAELRTFIEAGRAVAPDPDAVPPLAAESVIGSITQAIGRYSLERGRERDPVAAVPEMMYLAVRPYLGEEEARKELAIAPPPD
jgi:AcrR family transcriptional regulator